MNTYLITDNIGWYGTTIIIVVADNEDEAFSFINAKKDDTYSRSIPDHRLDKTIPIPPLVYPRYTVEQIDTTTKGEKYNQYHGE